MDKKFTKQLHYGPIKRKFHGNQHIVEKGTDFASSSVAKLRNDGDDSFDAHCDPSISYCIIQFTLIFNTLQTLLKCKTCNGDVSFLKYGQRFKLCIKCLCDEKYIDSCPMIGYEINRRFVFAMRLIGVGIHGINLFCGMMDLCKTYNEQRIRTASPAALQLLKRPEQPSGRSEILRTCLKKPKAFCMVQALPIKAESKVEIFVPP
ncbi:uncharacterized protein LOC118647281 [Monomorium pharaonis]|uniref:uncharacterized protein LOC118647281 n=1 Tax=Monomorium pharaonis TaxID=307658 RepID=UPI001746ADE0|nr:uncharacterized protein LOC118647281 [Monomorium pharaonis]